MSANADDELQRMAEEGGSMDSRIRDLNSVSEDLMAYRKLFSILGQQPEHKPSGIEEAVITRIRQSRKRSAFVDHVWLALGIIFLGLIGIAAVAISGFRISLSGGQREIMALGICAGTVIVLLNVIERKLLRR